MNLNGMTTKQLRVLRNRIDDLIVMKQQAAKTELKAQFSAMASDAGLSLSDLISGKPSKSKRPMLWRDKKTGVKWTGRGRMPFNFEKARAEKIE